MSFGDGTDGDVTISVDTTLTADMNYNNLTINAGVTLNPDGYIIYVKETLTLNGTISRNGNNGQKAPGEMTGGNGGAALPSRSLGGSEAGGNGGGTGDGVPGSSITDGIANSSGGAGNTGSEGSGGIGGTTITNHIVSCSNIDDIVSYATSRMGGPGGGGSGAYFWYIDEGYWDAGGGGGSGAGVMYISAKTITGNGLISAIGGVGGFQYYDVYRGGGGGGGAIIVEYNNKDNYTGTVNVNGGSGTNSGTAGTIVYCYITVEITISGNVKNSDSFDLPDVEITSENTSNYETSTDSSGNYSQVVSPDIYTVTALLPGSTSLSDTIDATVSSQIKNFVFPIITAPHDKGIRLKERYLLE